MSWGDSWGSRPWSYHEKFVKAFFEGREYGGKADTRVALDTPFVMEYIYKRGAIARFTPPSFIPAVAAVKLRGEYCVEGLHYLPVMQFRCYWGDKAEARHLHALGIEAVWQYDKDPFLAFGADVSDGAWRTIEECKELPK